MRWYVLQTKTGGEEKLADMIRKLLAPELYEECFTVYFEQLWRRRAMPLYMWSARSRDIFSSHRTGRRNCTSA